MNILLNWIHPISKCWINFLIEIWSGYRKLKKLLNWFFWKNENWLTVWIEFVLKSKLKSNSARGNQVTVKWYCWLGKYFYYIVVMGPGVSHLLIAADPTSSARRRKQRRAVPELHPLLFSSSCPICWHILNIFMTYILFSWFIFTVGLVMTCWWFVLRYQMTRVWKILIGNFLPLKGKGANCAFAFLGQ